ncbi:hypothetical protein GCM10009552_16100 [Rothia nasimurium]|uniref:Rha family transcriptional regulator n=1 Tax=Luteibacter anthropi TaxID=564369 RepID=A0A7X5UBG1_9GAMM|nr:Rha family transcriptional regulator [Luteibacter anthropi]NII07269.1 Rha family transcriptional regulator [Luteibacter anthropi]
MSNVIHLVMNDSDVRASSLELAQRLGIQHKNVLGMVRRYASDFKELGRVAFETRSFDTAGGAQKRETALLNEDQCYLLLSFSRNTPLIRSLKVELVRAFGRARQAGAAYSMTVWQELQKVQLEDADSRVRASFGSKLMLDRKRALPGLRTRRASLENAFAPDMFRLTG